MPCIALLLNFSRRDFARNLGQRSNLSEEEHDITISGTIFVTL